MSSCYNNKKFCFPKTYCFGAQNERNPANVQGCEFCVN